MKIVIIGGGPAGLYLALLARRASPAHEVVVLERNRADATFGWGVVFSDQTLENFERADPESCAEIRRHFAHWDDIDVHVKGATITSGGHGFSGIARPTLLRILQQRAAALGADLRFECDVRSDADLERLGLAGADVIVGADGVNSGVRQRHAAHFMPSIDVRSARFLWLGTERQFDAFTFCIRETDTGVYQAHAYRFEAGLSTFIVECDEASWRAAGFESLGTVETIARLESMFGEWLDGHALLSRSPHLSGSAWVRFPLVKNEHWHHNNVVLAGDAAHTAHFSIGSGTKLAMEDAIALARALGDGTDLAASFERYQAERQTEALRLQNAARNSMEWFENVRRYVHLDPVQFAYSLLTRSQRVGHENLRLRDGAYLHDVERWFASRADAAASPGRAAPSLRTAAPDGRVTAQPPMFTPFRLRDLTLENRVVVAPMDMYSAIDGTPNDFHLVHLGARALGGAGLVMTEMTCVSAEGRISPGCTGMYREEHADAWLRVTRFVHERSRARICLQLGHSGRKGSTRLMWEGNEEVLPADNWEVLGPSPLPHAPGMHQPRALTRADMDRVRDEFVRAVPMAERAEFDMLELHCAHGYLLSSFLTPLANRRDDEYGGSLENRLRYPLDIFCAMRDRWPPERPMSVRISATDWVEGGVDGAEAVEIARAFHGAGADIIHVSTGQTSPDARPVYGRMFQTPYSDRIRNEARIPTIAVGNIVDADQVNGIIMAGRADLCALARPHLADPNWTLRAAAQLGYELQWWPVQYESGRRPFAKQLTAGSGSAGSGTPPAASR